MPRNSKPNTEDIVAGAMTYFWNTGFSATSMNTLVNETGVSRKAIYKSFQSKDELFIACLEAYRDKIVTPAFEQVESKGANLASIEEYFECQIRLAEDSGFPGIGCLFGNTMTEIAPHDENIYKMVQSHNKRLELGFLNALKGELKQASNKINSRDLVKIVNLTACVAQGIWSHSRVAKDANELRTKVATLLELIEIRIKI